MDSKLDSITHNARYLMSAWTRSENTIYDEVDSTFHHYHPDGTLEIASPYFDNTTFYLKFVGERLAVEVKRLDNYKLHLQAKFVAAAMDEEDWAILEEILARLSHETRSREKLAKLAIRPVWEALFDALFPDGSWGQRPTRSPSLKRNSHLLALAFHSVVKKARRLGEWEWKEWGGIGVASLNKLAPLRNGKIKIPYPTAAEQNAVLESEAFCEAVLGWFDSKLASAGMTLIATSPMDETQAFSLVPRETLQALTAALDLLCIHYRLPPIATDR